jgi:taurine dioxygenase
VEDIDMSTPSATATTPTSSPAKRSSSGADWHIERQASALGAEIRGVDLGTVSEEDVARIQSLLCEHMVLFFPDQHLSVDQHVNFGRHFGRLEGHPNLSNPFTQHPELFELAASAGGVADEWHTDLTFLPEPALMSILHMVKCPDTGGDTMWSSLCAAFDALSPPMQEMCEGLSALHDAHPHRRADRMTIHPVVRVHPETGRKALYVNQHFTRRIVEMSAEESDVLLRFLTSWVQNPNFTCRYRWSEGTIAMWDNRCTQHCVLNDFDGERIIQRVTVMGDKPMGESPRWPAWTELEERRGALTRHDRQLQEFLNS